jgi:hypothetical protein
MLTDLVTPEALEVQASVAQQAFETLAEMAVFPIQMTVAMEGAAEPIFAASLRYLGECTGSVRLECSPELAYVFTQRVISGSEPNSLDSDVRDAIGELVNTIGGNLKGLLPAGVRLNTPKVLAEKPLDASAASCLSCLTFKSQFGAFRLLLMAS